MSRYTSQYDTGRRSHRPTGGLVEAGLTLLGGLALGAGVMYLLDPDEGPRRRKYIRRSASGAFHSAGDLLSSAYGSVADSATSMRDRASDMTSSASDLLRRSRDTAMEYVPGHEDEDDSHNGLLLGLVLGGSALAAVAYMLTTEYDSIRRGDVRGALSNTYDRASDAVTSAAHRTSEYFSGSAQDQGTQQT